jgi:Macrocin-O-methyltransferase (TylF)
MPLFSSKINHLLALTEADRDAKEALARGETPCLVVDADFFAKLGVGVTITSAQTIVVGEAIGVLQAMVAEGKQPFVLYAVEHAQDGLALIEWLTDQGFKYRGAGGYDVGGYVHDDRIARETIETALLEQTFDGYEKFWDPGSHQDFVNLTQALYRTRRLTGNVVEVGCFRGSSGSVMLDYAANKNLPPRRFWFFDVFQGFDYDEALASSDATWANSHATEGDAIVRQRLERKAGANQVTVKKLNIITDETPDDLGPIVVANIDVDLYEAVLAGLTRIAPLMQIGGIMICEDAGHTPALVGAALALEQFLDSDLGAGFTPVHMTSGQTFLVRHS